ncbi:MAG TPA: ParA family protein [Ktedonobacteraceae bacterium]|nr:ParA family protein [Ktedonobacteraceae bacterium]
MSQQSNNIYRSRRVAIFIPKGGVGKTTTAVNLAAALRVNHGKRVLLVDFDPQASATAFLGVDPETVERNINHLLNDVRVQTREVITQTESGVDLLPSHPDLAENIPSMKGPRYQIVRDILEPIEEDYDYIIIDSPPQESGLTWNILAYAKEIVVPLEAHYLSVRGLADALSKLEIARGINPDLQIKGILLTKVNLGVNIHKTYIEQVRRHAPQLVYPFMVGLTVVHQEAASAGQPIILYDPAHSGSIVYDQLAREFL